MPGPHQVLDQFGAGDICRRRSRSPAGVMIGMPVAAPGSHTEGTGTQSSGQTAGEFDFAVGDSAAIDAGAKYLLARGYR